MTKDDINNVYKILDEIRSTQATQGAEIKSTRETSEQTRALLMGDPEGKRPGLVDRVRHIERILGLVWRVGLLATVPVMTALLLLGVVAFIQQSAGAK